MAQEQRLVCAVATESGRYDRADLSDYLNSWFSVHFRVHDAKLHNKLA